MLMSQLPDLSQGPLTATVIERHEGVVEDQRRSTVEGDQSHEAQARGQEELVGRALRELPPHRPTRRSRVHGP